MLMHLTLKDDRPIWLNPDDLSYLTLTEDYFVALSLKNGEHFIIQENLDDLRVALKIRTLGECEATP